MASENGSSKWVRLLQLFVVAAVAILLSWVAVSKVPSMIESLRISRCTRNLTNIATAIGQYRQDNSNQFPLWLTALYPKYLVLQDVFVCPMDRLDRKISAQPEWMKEHDTGREDDLYKKFVTVDLDGPTGNSDGDQDTVPCSYLYALNSYVEPGFDRSWREDFTERQKSMGWGLAEMPIIRCYHHLPAKPPPEFNEFGERIPRTFDESYEFPTFNIQHNQAFKKLPFQWWERE